MRKLVQLIMLKCLQIINWYGKDVINKDWLIKGQPTHLFGEAISCEKIINMGDIFLNNTWKYVVLVHTYVG